jgi:hypothetical protein
MRTGKRQGGLRKNIEKSFVIADSAGALGTMIPAKRAGDRTGMKVFHSRFQRESGAGNIIIVVRSAQKHHRC